MLVWRICSKARARRAFDGEGARRYGGRWNRRGTPMVYTAATLSLAVLELLVHLEPEELPEGLVSVSAAIPENLEVETIPEADLPRGWRRYPAPEELQRLGTSWIESGRTAVLSVPSAVIPQERNYLLNPRHPAFGRIRIDKPQVFHFDPRMWRAQRR